MKPGSYKDNEQSGPEAPEQGAGAALALPRHSTSALIGSGREAIIEHGSEEYRLRLTSKGKLILTK
jgi:hemin uptake protein HemP